MFVADIGRPWIITFSDSSGVVTTLAGYSVKQARFEFDDGTADLVKDMSFYTDGSDLKTSFDLTASEQGANVDKVAKIQYTLGNGSTIDLRVDGGKALFRARI